MSFPAYAEYKDTGVEWLGEVPKRWSVPAARMVCQALGSGTTPPDKDEKAYGGEINWVTTGELREKGISSTRKKLTQHAIETYSALKLYPKGTLLIAMYGATIGRLGWLESNATVNQACCALQTSDPIDTRFLYYTLVAGKEELLLRGSGGGQPNINREKVASLRIAWPTFNERKCIVAFLDRETAKIDAAVAAQERLIALLAEKRAATISHAVTKGLDPDAPMKDSGIEWLGQIPAHWEAKRLRFLCKIETGDGDTQDAVEDGQYPFFVRSPNIETINRYSFDCEAVMTSGDGAGVGKIYHHFSGKFTAHQRVYVFHGFNDILPRLVYHYFKSYFARVTLQGTAKSTVESLRRPLLADFWVVVPEVSEQGAVLEYCDKIDRKYEDAIARCEDGIRLLKERRAALISAAVTGKIEVRGEIKAQEQEAA